MPSCGKKLMPTEAVTAISMPRMRAGSQIESISLRATSTAASGRCEVDQQDDQFVAAAATEQVRLADDVAHAAGDDRQHLVADTVAVAVVQQAEVVEVDEQQRTALALGVRSGQQPPGTLVEGLAVRKLRQRVDRREPLDALLRADLVA